MLIDTFNEWPNNMIQPHTIFFGSCAFYLPNTLGYMKCTPYAIEKSDILLCLLCVCATVNCAHVRSLHRRVDRRSSCAPGFLTEECTCNAIFLPIHLGWFYTHVRFIKYVYICLHTCIGTCCRRPRRWRWSVVVAGRKERHNTYYCTWSFWVQADGSHLLLPINTRP